MKDMAHEQLIRATYVVAKYENPKTAQLLTELAGRLDCALVAARTACLERDSAVRAEVEWETAMRQAVGEDGVDDVVLAIEKLKAGLDVQSARSDALAAKLNDVCAENAALIGFDADEFSYNGPYQPDDAVLEKLKTPATDAWVNEQRAAGVDMVVKYHMERAEALKEVDRKGSFNHSSAALDALDVAAQLRGSQV